MLKKRFIPFGLALGLLLQLGCGQSPRVVAHLCGDISIPGDIDSVRLSLRDETGEEVAQGVVQLFQAENELVPGVGNNGGNNQESTSDGGVAEAPCPKGEVQDLPVTFDLHNGAGNVWVVAQGLKDQVEVMHSEARARFPVSGAEHVYLGLQKSCFGAFCAFGQTCVEGKCEIAVFNGDESICPSGGIGKRHPVTDEDCQGGVP